MVEVYENQRYWIYKDVNTIKKWCSQFYSMERGQFSDVAGNSTSMEEVTLPESGGWSWADNWKVYVSTETDDEGWRYANNFLTGFHASCTMTDFVRRRRWIRIRERLAPASSASELVSEKLSYVCCFIV